jgi:LPXTG-motif cell wall-anchored protein
MAVFFAALACGYIVQAWSGSWTTGDWRSSEGFVALNAIIALVGAPLMIGVALVYGWRRHRSK